MTIELVTAPWVRAIARPVIDPDALMAFALEHGLKDLIDEDNDTPLDRIWRNVAGYDEHETDADILSEFAGRFCYRSWDKGRSTADYLGNVIAERHGNVLAHTNVSFIVTGVSRALTHELIRHHVGTNPSQESQRYVTAEGGEIEVIGFKAMRAVVPPLILKWARDKEIAKGLNPEHFMLGPDISVFRADFEAALSKYDWWLKDLKAGLPADMSKTLKKKRANEAARCFLPNACETRLVWTMNMRAARNVIEQRGDEHADLEIRRLAVAFTHELKEIAPRTFADAEVYTAADGFEAVRVAHSKV